MANYDGRLIDPTGDELVGALGTAMKAANRGNRYWGNRMTRDAAFWGRFAQDVLRGGAEGRRRSCKGGRAVPEVVAGWWTDPAGRKHVRVVGRTRHKNAQMLRETDLRELPPWWHVYPEAVVGVRGPRGAERYLAVCRCGAVGAPGALGWMGDTCGPCFDRRADGDTPVGGFGQFHGWLPALAQFRFTPDGRHLIGQDRNGRFQKVSRADGTVVTAKRKSVFHVAAMGTDAAGTVIAMQEGSVFRWRNDADVVEPVLAGRRVWGRVVMPPDASRVALLSYQAALVADLTAARPRYAELAPPEPFTAVQFAPDGRHLLAVTFQGEVRALDPDTLVPAVVRRDTFDGMPAGYGLTEMTVAPDGSAVLLRRESNYPRGVTVRHVPLPAGKVVELRLPDWHRAATLAYSPDGRHAVTAEFQAGGWVGFWEVASGRSLGFVRAVLEDTAWRSGHIEFAPDGGAVAVSYNSSNQDHGATVAVWPWPDALAAAGEG